MLDKVKSILSMKGFVFTESRNKASGVRNLVIGNRADVMRCLGSVRPVRLLEKFDPFEIGAMMGKTVKLVRKVFVGPQIVAAISTDAKTFIAEGLASHNCSYDWVVLCQLFGTMMDLPKGWPMYCRDVKQLADSLGNPKLPDQKTAEHHALSDAVWTQEAWQFLQGHSEVDRHIEKLKLTGGVL
jgi:hypothetical protein